MKKWLLILSLGLYGCCAANEQEVVLIDKFVLSRKSVPRESFKMVFRNKCHEVFVEDVQPTQYYNGVVGQTFIRTHCKCEQQ